MSCRINKKLDHARDLMATDLKKARTRLYQISKRHCSDEQLWERRWLLENIKLVERYGKEWETEFNKFLVRLAIGLIEINGKDENGHYHIEYDNKTGYFKKYNRGAWSRDYEVIEKGDILDFIGDIYYTRGETKRRNGKIYYFEYGGEWEKYNNHYEADGENWLAI